MVLGIVTFFSEIAPETLIQEHLEILKKSKMNILSANEYMNKMITDSDDAQKVLLLYIGTGGTENLVAEFISHFDSEVPVILLSHMHNNSLPAAMEIRTFLQQQEFESKILHTSLSDLATKLQRWDEILDKINNIRNSRIGLLGEPSSWLIASSVNLEAVRQLWGTEFIEYDLAVLELSSKVETKSNIPSDLLGNVKEVLVPEDELLAASSVATILLEHIRNEKLNGVTIQCFDYLIKNEISGCLAVCHANDQDGIVAGCEGDIPSVFSMLIAKELTGTPNFMANVTSVDKTQNSVTFAHCTVPTTIVNDYDLLTHFETDLSVGVRGRFEPQEVTILKVFGDSLSEFWVSSGEILKNLHHPDGCRTQIQVHLHEDVSYFLEHSFANHHVIIPGDHKSLIEEFFSLVRFIL